MRFALRVRIGGPLTTVRRVATGGVVAVGVSPFNRRPGSRYSANLGRERDLRFQYKPNLRTHAFSPRAVFPFLIGVRHEVFDPSFFGRRKWADCR